MSNEAVKWSNWETQCVNEWMTEMEEEKFVEMSRSCLAESSGHWAKAAAELAVRMETEFYRAVQVPCGSFIRSLIRGAMKNVRYREIAAAWIDWAVMNPPVEEEESVPKDGDVVTKDGVYFHVWRGGRVEEVAFWVDDDLDDTWWELLFNYREDPGREKADAWGLEKGGRFIRLKEGDKFSD